MRRPSVVIKDGRVGGDGLDRGGAGRRDDVEGLADAGPIKLHR
ncbi:hypothetical protein [Streptomyces sp. FL07-04A]|nr:hypothetical protein [Streptomyces sp. FL07-04A]MDX3577454.1 hypothetical protein [Streptomyces sp. FL07-04A]